MSNAEPKRPGLAYYQAASLILLIVVTGFSIAGLWGVAQIISPALTIASFEWRGLQARSTYLKANYDRRDGRFYPSAPGDTAGFTLDDVTERWRDARSEALAFERREGVRRVLLWIVALVVCLPLYRYHQRVVDRAMKPSEEGGA